MSRNKIFSFKFPSLIAGIYLVFFISCNFKNSERWGYTIGQKDIPGVVIQKDTSYFKVYPRHPRLFFRDTDLREIRKRIKGEFQPEWQEMLTHLETRVLTRPAADFAQGSYLKSWSNGRNLTFVAAITAEQKYISWAIQWAEALAAAGPVGIDDHYRGRLMSLAVAYDWLFPWLTEAEKQNLEKAITEHIDKNWYFATGADYVGGHSRWGNFSLAAGLLALITEHPELHSKLLIVRNHWINGYHPAQSWIAEEGGYHMGWSYSAAYLTGDNHCVWSSATNECVYYPWQALMPMLWIYGRQGDGYFPNTGDAYTVSGDLNSDRDLLMIAGGIFKSPYAAYMAKPTPDRFADILYGDKTVKPMAPDDPDSLLPLSCHFRNSGVVLTRDRWDDKTTLLQFRSVPFYSANHHHRDENCFTLHYKGGLAIDAGLYDEGGPNGGYGRSHWINYFTRTVAHNGIVVFDPDQIMKVYGKPASNDGGQTYRTEPKNLKDIQAGGHASLDGIRHYQDTKEYTYAAGDATKAYDADHVKLAQRDIVYLRLSAHPHPVVLIFDRVESTKPDYEKRFILHTVNEPIIKGKLAVTENKGGRLSSLTLYPEDAKLQLIGGPGKEAWVNGVNYPIDKDSHKGPQFETGAWRLEVSPGTKQTMDYFLHVLFVDDAGATQVDPRSVELIKDKNSIGARVAGWKVSFPLAKGSNAAIEHIL